MFECCIYVISLHPTSLCPSLQLLKFMVSYSLVIIVTYTCIHTLITMFCLIDFSVAYTSMCLGPTAWYWLVHHSLEARLVMGPSGDPALSFAHRLLEAPLPLPSAHIAFSFGSVSPSV